MRTSIVLGSMFFTILICCTMITVGYRIYGGKLDEDCTGRLGNMLSYYSKHMDDPVEGVTAFDEKLLDDLADYGSMKRLYIIFPENSGSYDQDPKVFCTGGDSSLVSDRLEGEDYLPRFRALYLETLQSGSSQPMFYRNESDEGWEYTGLMPLRNSMGVVWAVIGGDMDMEGARQSLRSFVIGSITAAVIMLACFLVLVRYWLEVRLVRPLRALTYSVADYARQSHEQDTPDGLHYVKPDINTGDEIEDLADAVATLSNDMNDYVERFLLSRSEMRIMKRHVDKMDEIAYKDSLTGVSNKASYDRIKSRLDWDIMNNKARFAIVMIDLNHLKSINDAFGHEAGDEYIRSATDIMNRVFLHSPIFRVGGDEFVVVLENKDYNDREQLVSSLRAEFDKSAGNTTIPEKQRVSAAVGFAVYNKSGDNDSDSVFRRADNNMYDNNKSMKELRED